MSYARSWPKANLKRCGMELRLIVPVDSAPVANEASIKTLQAALAKALDWNQALLEDRASSMSHIARQEGMTQRYVARMLRMAFLSPRHIEKILSGDVPIDSQIEIFRSELPTDWKQQAISSINPPHTLPTTI